MVGVKMVFPGPHLDGRERARAVRDRARHHERGRPTVWLALLNFVKENRLRFSTLKTLVIGGSAAPPAMIRAFRNDFGVNVLHAWGMTEMSPLGHRVLAQGEARKRLAGG